jgi:hypothetical protein
MKPFNVTLIQPDGYKHSLALLEAAQYVHACLSDCGYRANLSANTIAPEAHNIVFCAHMMSEAAIAALPPDTIVFNSEQLLNRGSWQLTEHYKAALARFYIWDYSIANLSQIQHARKDFIPFTFHPTLLRSPGAQPGDRLLFYGALTDRRTKLIDEIKAAGVPVDYLYGSYGEERDAQMLRAWAVLNIRGYEGVGTFEPIRCFHPLANNVPVISETAAHDATFQLYSHWLFSFPERTLVDAIAQLYADRPRFAALAREKCESFRASLDAESVGDAADLYLETVNAAAG